MKAAVLEKLGEAPQYKDFDDPQVENDNQVLLNVKAAAVKNLDKLRASGKHYASHTHLPDVVGMDGVGTLEDGKRVYAQGVTGMIAEKAIIDKNKYTPIPEDLDFPTAAAIPNAVLGAAMPVLVRGKLESGENILINGGTGFTGNLAIQISKEYGAKNIIVAGRGKQDLKRAQELGADKIVDTDQEEDKLVQALQDIHKETPIDLIIDYLWGKPMESILKALEGKGLDNFSHRVRIVSVGSLAGHTIELDSETLRSSDIQILGSGFGSLSEEDLEKYRTQIIPEIFQMAADDKITVDLEVDSLENIESLWNKEIQSGKRLVIQMD